MTKFRSKKSRLLHAFLVRWVQTFIGKPTAERLVETLSCEGTAGLELSESEQNYLTQFRHLNTADRLRVARNALEAVGPKGKRLF